MEIHKTWRLMTNQSQLYLLNGSRGKCHVEGRDQLILGQSPVQVTVHYLTGPAQLSGKQILCVIQIFNLVP
jgi:hypothetical protein